MGFWSAERVAWTRSLCGTARVGARHVAWCQGLARELYARAIARRMAARMDRTRACDSFDRHAVPHHAADLAPRADAIAPRAHVVGAAACARPPLTAHGDHRRRRGAAHRGIALSRHSAPALGVQVGPAARSRMLVHL